MTTHLTSHIRRRGGADGSGRRVHGPPRSGDIRLAVTDAVSMEVDGGRPVSVTRVLVADDHPVYRDGLRTMLEATDDLRLVVEASDGEEAVRALAQHPVDVALLDVNMPRLNGIEAAARIAAEAPGVAVLVLTMFADDASVFAALRAGARGYVLKDSSRDDLLRAIRAVARGEAIFSPSVATRVLDFFARQHHPSIAPEDFPMLTTRERDVLHLLAQGRSNPQIAAQLGLTRKTTSNYVSAVLTKLQVRDRAEAAQRARQAP
jgi:DNA-binding NarL/FixJ family response regulator